MYYSFLGNIIKINLCTGPDSPLIHFWLRFNQIKVIYPIDKLKAQLRPEELENEDGDRWVEVPDDYLKRTTPRYIIDLSIITYHNRSRAIPNCSIIASVGKQ